MVWRDGDLEAFLLREGGRSEGLNVGEEAGTRSGYC